MHPRLLSRPRPARQKGAGPGFEPPPLWDSQSGDVCTPGSLQISGSLDILSAGLWEKVFSNSCIYSFWFPPTVWAAWWLLRNGWEKINTPSLPWKQREFPVLFFTTPKETWVNHHCTCLKIPLSSESPGEFCLISSLLFKAESWHFPQILWIRRGRRTAVFRFCSGCGYQHMVRSVHEGMMFYWS